MKKIFTKLIAAAALLLAGLAQAQGSATEQLTGLLTGYQTFSARFEQFIMNNDGRRGQQTQGELLLAKPNKFYWRTDKPFPQVIVGDGDYIWVYDPDLEQVTRKPAGQQQASAPAMLLNGQIDQLSEQYRIEQREMGPGEQLFELIPKQENGNFARIRLFFANQVLSELMLEDHLGQRTTVLLHDQQMNPVLAPSRFRFEAPEGTDIIIDETL
ncbi:outer membrane lipoprotein chaperone LolA [Marinobacterium arenosum]|uniref:outer membrane lipoprotein chaperone LolA n=1 Tax=Marinobacterium arenosum TaxID=2862496 RepID=UPI001C94EDA4|nr:outer membrane lipoprotein chaperone LolA [Marinobacterium arenosum]MBY4677855.1 outer membrane lipoprotein chaperone LolA [Marinobacterium arenosum]